MKQRWRLAALLVTAGCGARTGLSAPDIDVPEIRDVGHDHGTDVPGDQGVCFEATLTPWQFHDTTGPACLPITLPGNGDPDDFAYASIPLPTDPGWVNYASATINFSRASRLCGTRCACREGVDFDYWQTYLDVPEGATIGSLEFTIRDVDDGARVTVFNTAHPTGVVDPGSYVTLGQGTTANLAGFITPGRNRIVITHVDDCCSQSFIRNASLTLDGASARVCR